MCFIAGQSTNHQRMTCRNVGISVRGRGRVRSLDVVTKHNANQQADQKSDCLHPDRPPYGILQGFVSCYGSATYAAKIDSECTEVAHNLPLRVCKKRSQRQMKAVV